MAEQKEKQRFLFFKYVPPKKEDTTLKNEEYIKKDEKHVPQVEEVVSDEHLSPEPSGWFPEQPECPELPGFPECPEVPEIPEYPELPECPEVPECPEPPEYPEPPECPEPPEEPEGPCPEDAVMHVIQAGDTFWKLAKKYDTSVESIVAANPYVDPMNLQIGATICIPAGIPGAKG